uniref:Secreted protein n=1 Tax=Opuntia streptacantha TaxID=393608 RepID=A0A7C9E220_OPUST
MLAIHLFSFFFPLLHIYANYETNKQTIIYPIQMGVQHIFRFISAALARITRPVIHQRIAEKKKLSPPGFCWNELPRPRITSAWCSSMLQCKFAYGAKWCFFFFTEPFHPQRFRTPSCLECHLELS